MFFAKKAARPGLGLVLLLLMSLTLLACGDEASSDALGYNATPVASLTALSLNECAARVENPIPTSDLNSDKAPAGFRLFASNTYPYVLFYPDKWELGDKRTAGNLASDLFIAERTSTGRAFVYVLSEKLEADRASDSKAYYQDKIKEFKANNPKIQLVEQPSRKVGGQDAYAISYNSNEPYQTQQIQLIFTSANRGWVVSFSSTPNLGQRYCPTFSQILDTFRIQEK